MTVHLPLSRPLKRRGRLLVDKEGGEDKSYIEILVGRAGQATILFDDHGRSRTHSNEEMGVRVLRA